MKHGYARVGKKTTEYKRWEGINKRCNNKNGSRYAFYGAKGITVCDRWKTSFLNFFEDMGLCPPGYELDRIDNTKGYEPTNCRWVTLKENKRNMSNNHPVTINAETKIVIEWCEDFNIPKGVVYQRIHRGWPENEWFKPVNSPKTKRKQNEQ
jgi:hypothetical protein